MFRMCYARRWSLQIVTAPLLVGRFRTNSLWTAGGSADSCGTAMTDAFGEGEHGPDCKELVGSSSRVQIPLPHQM